MADKKRTINADLFSTRGLDERQKEISAKLGTRCFRMLYYLIFLLTGVWFIVYSEGYKISFEYTAISYYAASMLVSCIYAIYASKYGVLNNDTAVSYTQDIVSIVCMLFLAVMFFIVPAYRFLAIFSGLTIAEKIIFYFCGKRNFKVLEEQMEEDGEDE